MGELIKVDFTPEWIKNVYDYSKAVGLAECERYLIEDLKAHQSYVKALMKKIKRMRGW
jgi:hypothetical protein